MATPTLEHVLKERVAALVGDDLAEVEAEIRRELHSPVPLIQEMGGYIAGAGGKRLRPILLLLAARLADYRGPRAVRLACVVEMLHTATLIHDDVVDQAPLRRGRPSANAQWGDDASVLVGDHLYSKSFAMLVRDNDRGGHGDAGPLDGVDDRGRGVPAPAQAQRPHLRGRLRADHHPEDRLVHVRLLPHRRPAGRGADRADGGAHALRPRHRHRVPDLRRRAGLHGRPGPAGQGDRRRPARGQADAAAHRDAGAGAAGRRPSRCGRPCGAAR